MTTKAKGETMKASKMGMKMRTVALCASLIAGTANAQSPDFRLVNNTGFTVYSVHVWPSTWTNPGSDSLRDGTLKNGNSVFLRPVNNGGCSYNMRISFENSEREEQWEDINLCDISTITLRYAITVNKD